MLTTRFTERFGVDHPILSAPVGGATDSRLAAAVSAAGALGTFQAWHPTLGLEWLVEQIAAVRAATARPFGVGFIVAFMDQIPGRFDAACDAGVPVVALSFGDPSPWIARAHGAGAKVVCQVQTLRQAREAVDAGADAIAAQGVEAGGHTGTMGLLPLLGAVLDDCDGVPVLAAGGVASGRTLAAVLAMGADGAWIGSAFIATVEAALREEAKALIVASDGGDTVWTRAYDIVDGRPWPEGIGERVRDNAFTRRWEGRDDELRDRRGEVTVPTAFDADESPVLYGQSAAFVRSIRPAADVVAEIVGDAERRLRR